MRVASRAAQVRRLFFGSAAPSLGELWRPLDPTRTGSGTFAAPVMATAIRRSDLECPASHSRRDAVVQQFLSLADGLARRFQQRFAGLIELDDARQVARFELIRPTAYLKPGGCTTLPASSVVSTPTPAWPGHRSASPSACGSPAWSVNS